MTGKKILLPKFGNRTVVVRDRHDMKRHHTPRRMQLAANAAIPATFDFSGGLTTFPDYGNVETATEEGFGDCVTTETLYQIYCMTMFALGTPGTISRAAAIAWYLQLAGGDNGLSDGQIAKAMTTTGVPGQPTWKFEDVLDVDPLNLTLAQQACYYYCGFALDLSLSPKFSSDFEPGVTWDVPCNPQEDEGHRILIIGWDATRNAWRALSWETYLFITPAAIAASDPTGVAAFCELQFNAQGIAPSGLTRTATVGFWEAAGGKTIPAGPTPVVPPVVVPPVVVTPPPTPVNPPDPAPVMVPQRPELTGNGIYQASQLVRKIVNGEADSKTKMAMASLLTAAAVQCGNYYYASAPIPDQTAIPVGQAAAPPLSTPTPGQPLSGAKPKSWTAEDVMATQEMTEAAGFMSSDAVSKHAAMELVARLLNRVTGAQ